MKNLQQLARRSLHNLGAAATKRVIKQFAAKYHLVYFGHVDPREDEYELVRGITVSTTHADNHYSVGSYNGHDIIVVERRNTLTFPGKPDSHYHWTIMQVDLKRIGLPHVFIDGRHHDAVFYANAFTSSAGMQDLSSYFTHTAPEFQQHMQVFANAVTYVEVGALLTPELTTGIAQFHQFDFEWFDDRLLIYASNHVPTPATLDEMLRVGVWLAEMLDAL